MTEKIDSIKHPKDTRVHIPSKEEAGYEDGNVKVQSGKRTLELPINPVTTRGQDPELFWLDKYGNDDREELLRVDIRSLYRHEHIAPETIIKNLYRVVEDASPQSDLFGGVNNLFGNALERDELEKVSDYYAHHDGWTNRLIQGDSHLVMASLLEREGMAGQVQMIYIDPPYGIKYGSNWQIKLNDKKVTDGSDDSLTGEPEVIKAFRDTWELGVHSYLSYIRDRLLIAKELLTESGTCFVQISDENVHLVRSVMDGVFGSANFCSQISFVKTSSSSTNLLPTTRDYLLWYAKDKDLATKKYRKIWAKKSKKTVDARYRYVVDDNKMVVSLSKEQLENDEIPEGQTPFWASDPTSQGSSANGTVDFLFRGRTFHPGRDRHWSVPTTYLTKLGEKNRLAVWGKRLTYKRFIDDFPVTDLTDNWDDTTVFRNTDGAKYVVQTAKKVIQRCLLMTTDPGDLVLDPTCGSGTTAFVAEQFGRRWITIDTSRIALNIAKTWLMTARFPYYFLNSGNNVEYVLQKKGGIRARVTGITGDKPINDIRQGFVYKKVPHTTLKSLAYDEPPESETLYDEPVEDKKKIRVSGPFTVETLQNFEPVSPKEIAEENMVSGEAFEQVIKDHLLATGVKNGRKDEQVMFSRVEILANEYLHAEGFYQNGTGDKKAYFHIGPKFGTVSKKSVNQAIRECQARGDAQWLVVLGFSFESDITGSTQTTSMGTFEVTRARIHDDLLQEGLKKKPAKSAASFVTIGEPDIDLDRTGDTATVEIKGLDIYDPIKDEVKARNISDIAYWMVDDDYDGSNFVVEQVFFCGGDKDEFKKWQKGLDNLAKDKTRQRAEKTLKIEIDEEAFDRVYGHRSHPIKIKHPGQKIAVRVISQFGEESTKVLSAN